jgi:hypothetical protein
MMSLGVTVTSVGSNPIAVVFVVIATLFVGRRVARHVARIESDPKLANLLTFSLVLHLLCAPAQIFIVDHVYKGVADFNRYVFEGTRLADNLRSGTFSLVGTGIASKHLDGDGFTSIISGSVLTVLGPNKLAEFLFFAFTSFLGAVFFYRAFSITFPNSNRRRYAYLIFFLPSLLFWTADASKEAMMTFSLGLAALGVARVLARAKRGYILILIGGAIGSAVRPHEVALLVVSFAIAMLFRGRDINKAYRGIRKVVTFVFVVAIVGLSAYITQKFLGHTNSLSSLLNNIHQNNNSGTGAGFGSSNFNYSSSPLDYPKDVYAVLFDPLPISAHGLSQYLAAGENGLLILVILFSLRQIRSIPRAAIRRPYVLACSVYSLAFLYVFAALGNLGLIERERTLLLPFLLVPLCIPVTPVGEPPRYLWESGYRRVKGRHRQTQAGRKTPVSASRSSYN